MSRKDNRLTFWTWYYRLKFRRLGIRFGRGLRVMGPLILRLDGDPSNISIGRNVALMPWVDLKVRENGRIILHDGVFLDTMVRLVAAKDFRIEIGEGTQVSMGTVMNGGHDLIVGHGVAVGGNCLILGSEHTFEGGKSVWDQDYYRAPVYIGANAWLAADVLVRPGSRIGESAIIGAKSIVNGDIPALAVAAGNPAKIKRYRE